MITLSENLAIYLLPLASFRRPPELVSWQGGPMNFVVWTGENRDFAVEDIAFIAQWAYDHASTDIHCGGAACEIVHDIFDEVAVEEELEGMSPLGPDTVVLSNWYEGESLLEVIWNARNTSHNRALPVLVLARQNDSEVADLLRQPRPIEEQFEELLEDESTYGHEYPQN